MIMTTTMIQTAPRCPVAGIVSSAVAVYRPVGCTSATSRTNQRQTRLRARSHMPSGVPCPVVREPPNPCARNVCFLRPQACACCYTALSALSAAAAPPAWRIYSDTAARKSAPFGSPHVPNAPVISSIMVRARPTRAEAWFSMHSGSTTCDPSGDTLIAGELPCGTCCDSSIHGHVAPYI